MDYFLKTYSLQRHNINTRNFVSNAIKMWPILSDRNFFLLHVNLLLKVSNIHEEWMKNLANFPMFLNFFKHYLKNSNSKSSSIKISKQILADTKQKEKFINTKLLINITIFKLIFSYLGENFLN